MGRFLFSIFLSLFFISDALAIDINTADASTLTQFNGVGPATAKKIIAYREANGPFASCDDLTKVKGIGKKTLEKVKPTCTAGEAAEGKKVVSPANKSPKKPNSVPTGTININTADASALTKFNGVGPATAGKIIAYREANGPFASCDDLTKVKGIGKKTLEKIKPMCTTGKAAK
jgi:competence protein ComEA